MPSTVVVGTGADDGSHGVRIDAEDHLAGVGEVDVAVVGVGGASLGVAEADQFTAGRGGGVEPHFHCEHRRVGHQGRGGDVGVGSVQPRRATSVSSACLRSRSGGGALVGACSAIAGDVGGCGAGVAEGIGEERPVTDRGIGAGEVGRGADGVGGVGDAGGERRGRERRRWWAQADEQQREEPAEQRLATAASTPPGPADGDRGRPVPVMRAPQHG